MFLLVHPINMSFHTRIPPTQNPNEKSVRFSLTGFPPQKKNEILSLPFPTPLEQCYSNRLTKHCNLLVCYKALSVKYNMARNQNIAIVTPQYLRASSKAGKWLPVDTFRCPPLYGLEISLTGFDETKRIILQKKIAASGATYSSSMVRGNTTHLVVNEGAEKSNKTVAAKKWNVKTVREDWINHSVTEGFGMEEDAYSVFSAPLEQASASLDNKHGDNHQQVTFKQPTPSDYSHQKQQAADTLPDNIQAYPTQQQEEPTSSPSHITASNPAARDILEPFPAKDRTVRIRDHFLRRNFLLEQCTVYLLGFDEYPAVLRKTVQLLSYYGAVRLPTLIPHRLTHILVYKPNNDELQKLRNSFLLSDIGISVVMYRWLEHSIQQGTLLDESEYLFL